MLRNKHQIILLAGLLCAGVLAGGVVAQSVRSQLQTQNRRLHELEQEIAQYRKQLSANQQKEQSLVDQLNVLDKDVSYTQRLVRQMEQAQQERETEIKQLTDRLEENRGKLDRLKERFTTRVVHMYKRGRLNDLELLLSSESINQAVYRYKYLRVIDEADRKLFHAIRSTMESIQADRARLESERKAQEQLLADKRRESQRLRDTQKKRQQLLASVRNDMQAQQQALKDKEQDHQEILNMIAELNARSRENAQREETIRENRMRTMSKSTVDIPSLKGKLPWPVHGKVISRFGKFKHPKLKTVTENPGIDIAARKGTEVVAVLDGVVTMITWLRSYGNTIILDHGDGYYTVYAHVIDIQVSQNAYVQGGEVIASVGDSGSLDGSKLHFEFYVNKQPLNPETWLARIS